MSDKLKTVNEPSTEDLSPLQAMLLAYFYSTAEMLAQMVVDEVMDAETMVHYGNYHRKNMETLLTGGVVDPEGADMTLGSEPELNELFAQFMEELGEVVLKAEQENAA